MPLPMILPDHQRIFYCVSRLLRNTGNDFNFSYITSPHCTLVLSFRKIDFDCHLYVLSHHISISHISSVFYCSSLIDTFRFNISHLFCSI